MVQSSLLRITLQIEHQGGPIPPVELRIGGELAARGGSSSEIEHAPAPAVLPLTPAPAPAPAGARQPAGERIPNQPEAPAWQREQYFASAPDRGQHDVWKRELSLRLWRLLAGASVPLARSWFGLDGAGVVPQPQIFPLHTDLCNAIRRLGLRRLVIAALGLAEHEGGARLAPSQLPVGGPFRLFGAGPLLRNAETSADELARELLDQHLGASAIAVESAVAAEERRKASWNAAAQGPFVPMTAEAYEAYFALADAGVNPWERSDLTSCPALEPLRLPDDTITAPPFAADPPRRTPATGAVLPTPSPAPETAPVEASASNPPSPEASNA